MIQSTAMNVVKLFTANDENDLMYIAQQSGTLNTVQQLTTPTLSEVYTLMCIAAIAVEESIFSSSTNNHSYAQAVVRIRR